MNFKQRRGSLLASLIGLGAIGCSLEAPSGSPPQTGEATSPIVGGQLEHGWQPVGALVFAHTYGGAGKDGIFCTGTRIAPGWVLTAGHCVADTDYAPSAYLIHFFMGDDARTSGTGLPSGGRLFKVQSIDVHPFYRPSSGEHDIALLRLADDPGDLPVYPINTDASMVNTSAALFSVGYGVTDGVTVTGAGIKRSIEGGIDWRDANRYYTLYGNGGTCFGDSGGPGLLGDEGDAVVVGINSRHHSQGGVPCKDGYASRIRVDAFADWIETRMSAAAPSCQNVPSLCLCNAGCLADGRCDLSRCQVKACTTIVSCQAGCGGGYDCLADCYLSGSDGARERFDALYACTRSACGQLSGAARDACMSTHCASQAQRCETAPTGGTGGTGGTSAGGAGSGGANMGAGTEAPSGGGSDGGDDSDAGSATSNESAKANEGSTPTSEGCSHVRHTRQEADWALLWPLFALGLARRRSRSGQFRGARRPNAQEAV